MPEQLAVRLSVASLNTRGIPIRGSRLASRYAVIGTEFEAGRADVVCFQEVFSYWHLRLLARRMPSFGYVSCRPSVFGPAGGLVTFSRLPVSGQDYQGFGAPPDVAGPSRCVRFMARLKGAPVTRLPRPGLCVVNTHPVANWDGAEGGIGAGAEGLPGDHDQASDVELDHGRPCEYHGHAQEHVRDSAPSPCITTAISPVTPR